MIQYYHAIKIISDEFKKLRIKTERVNLLYSLNRIIAEDVYSDTDQPRFNNSAMDGVAIKYAKGIDRWKVIGEVKAGGFRNHQVRKGEAVLIMTGAKIPKGADTVIPFENLIAKGKLLKLFNNIPLRKGNFIRFKAEDTKKHKLLIRKNTLLESKNLAMAAACGKKSLRVFKKMKIGIIATGDELVDIKLKPKHDKIRASNIYSIQSAIAQMNMEPHLFGIVKDKKNEIQKCIKTALNTGVDILLTSGGISAGRYDLLKDIFCELGVKIRFSGVNIKPGKPLAFGVYEKQGKSILIYGLPGNPVSCYVNFILFVRNVIMKLYTLNENYYVSAILKHDLTKSDNKRHFLRGKIHNKNGVNIVSQIGSQSSANIGGLNSANCLIIQKERQMILRKGSPVECIVI